MPQFINNSCVALTWSADGQCHGIRVKRLRGKCKVTSVWAAKADKDHSVSELLAIGLRELDGKDASCLLASGTAGGWDMADVEMPHLPEEQLKHALSFEIQKHTPLSIDKLTWGYRQLRKPTTTTKGLYRIITMKSENWRQWCTTVEALSPLDAIIPPLPRWIRCWKTRRSHSPRKALPPNRGSRHPTAAHSEVHRLQTPTAIQSLWLSFSALTSRIWRSWKDCRSKSSTATRMLSSSPSTASPPNHPRTH